MTNLKAEPSLSFQGAINKSQVLVKGDQIGNFTIEFDQDCNQLLIRNLSDFPMQFKFLSAETALNGVIISLNITTSSILL